jgi:GMP synthase (glutamine-hydrolysing)
MNNAIAIRHVSFEDAGTVEPVLKDRGIDLRYLEAGVDDLTPAKDTDLLVVLGGPIGIYEVDRYPFLKHELAVIEAAVKKGLPVTGICLGCQALAAVLAARVYPGKQKELGWDEMTLTAEGKSSPLGAIEGVRSSTGLATRSTCRSVLRGLPPRRSRRTRPLFTGRRFWRCNFTSSCRSATWRNG